jgi:hypothetical protein
MKKKSCDSASCPYGPTSRPNPDFGKIIPDEQEKIWLKL